MAKPKRNGMQNAKMQVLPFLNPDSEHKCFSSVQVDIFSGF